VRDVRSNDDAANVAIAEAGKRLNPKHSYVDVTVGSKVCPSCRAKHEAVMLVAGWALVALLLELKVFDAQNEEHARRIARKEVGTALGDIPLRVFSVELMAEGGKQS